MIQVTDQFKQYMALRGRQLEIKATIGVATYNNDSVVECMVEGSLAPSGNVSIGEIAIQKMMLKIKTIDTIPANSKVTISIRPLDNGLAAEWIQLTPAYIDTRAYANRVWSFTCYDKLMYTNQKFVSQLVYPAKQIDVINEIAAQLGLALDPSVVINPNYLVPFQDLNATIHDVLSFIAASHGMSVKLTNIETIAFVNIKGSSVATIHPVDYFTAKQTNPVKTITKLKVYLDTEGDFTEIGVGDVDHILEVLNPYAGDINILNGMYTALNGFTYMPFTLDWKGNIYTELGDSITIEDLDSTTWLEESDTWGSDDAVWAGVVPYSTVILNYKLSFKNGLKCTSDASSNSQQKSEFKYEGSLSQQVKQSVKQGKAYYGVSFSKDYGLDIKHSGGRAEALFNADKLAFMVDNVDKFYYDSLANKLKFTGDMDMEGGSINWTQVGGPSYGNITGSKPPIDADNTYSVVGLKLTHIDQYGVYTGLLQADQVDAGTLRGVTIDVTTDARVGYNLRLGDTSAVANRMIEFYNAGASGSCFVGFTAQDLVLNNSAGDLVCGGDNIVFSSPGAVSIHSLSGGAGVFLDGPKVSINPTAMSFFGVPGSGQQLISELPYGMSTDELVSQFNTLTYGLAQLGLYHRIPLS